MFHFATCSLDRLKQRPSSWIEWSSLVGGSWQGCQNGFWRRFKVDMDTKPYYILYILLLYYILYGGSICRDHLRAIFLFSSLHSIESTLRVFRSLH